MYNYPQSRQIAKELERTNLDNAFKFNSIGSTDVFTCNYNGNGINMTMIIAIEDGDWIVYRYYIADINPSKESEFLKLMNTLNNERRLKYYIDDTSTITANFFQRAENSIFNANECIQMAVTFLKCIEAQDYPLIMKTLWG